MKKKVFLLIASLLLFTNMLSAQEEKQITQKETKVFCEIVGTQKLLSSKVIIEMDFGQERSWFAANFGGLFLLDESGKKIEFNSMIDAMNYLGKLGWEFEQAYVVTIGQQNVYHWLLSKKVKEGENPYEGFQTKGN